MLDTPQSNFDPQFDKYLRDFHTLPYNAEVLQGKRLSRTTPNNSQALIFNATSNQWEPGTAGDLPVYTAPDGDEIDITAGRGGNGIFLTGGVANTNGAGGQARLTGADGDGTGNGGDLRLQSGQGGATSGNGGLVEISAGGGNGPGTGGNILLEAGQGGSSNGTGGNAELKSGAGHGTNDAGDVILEAARSTGGVGNDGSVRITQSRVPTSASDLGSQGAIAWDADYIYICILADTWKRVAISTW